MVLVMMINPDVLEEIVLARDPYQNSAHTLIVEWHCQR